ARPPSNDHQAMSTDFLAGYTAVHPDKAAVIEGDRTFTYAEFNRLVNGYANALLGLGVQPGATVIWVAQNSTEVVAVVATGRKLGVVLVPMNYRLTAEEAAYVVDNSDAAAVLFD